jgi:hypothetical protein
MITQRPLVEQTLTTFALTVPVTPIPIRSSGSLIDMCDSFVLSVPASAANNVFLGDSSVTITTGIEIVAGVPINFAIDQNRQMFELQLPLEELVTRVACNPQFPSYNVPFICWNLSNLYVVAVANTVCVVSAFRVPYLNV